MGNSLRKQWFSTLFSISKLVYIVTEYTKSPFLVRPDRSSAIAYCIVMWHWISSLILFFSIPDHFHFFSSVLYPFFIFVSHHRFHSLSPPDRHFLCPLFLRLSVSLSLSLSLSLCVFPSFSSLLLHYRSCSCVSLPFISPCSCSLIERCAPSVRLRAGSKSRLILINSTWSFFFAACRSIIFPFLFPSFNAI